MTLRLCWLLSAIFLASCSGGSDSEETSTSTFNVPVPTCEIAPQPGSTHFTYGPAASVERCAVTELPTSKAQSINVNGNAFPFTATAGHLIAYDWASAPPKPTDLTGVDARAAIFYTAYTRDDLPRETRPITFVFNGGPGGGSASLDVDFLGPKGFDESAPPSTSKLPLIDNPNTLLDRTDLVFVDPVGTGYSMAIKPYSNQRFWGVDSDAKVLRDFITRYINVNNRQSSPKYIYGVSYGGIRAPIIARLLIESGTRDYLDDPGGKAPKIMTGLILNSPVLDEKADCYLSYVSCGGALPTYAMVADFHKRSAERGSLPVESFVTNMRGFAGEFNNRYISTFSGVDQKVPDRSKWEAFLKGPEAPGFVNRLFNITGIGKLYQPGDGAKNNPWIENPNMNAVEFTKKFDASRGRLRLTDGREFLPVETTDPSFDRTSFYSEFTWRYEQEVIGYNASAYYMAGNGEIIDRWDYRPDPKLSIAGTDRTAASIPDMAFSLTLNPGLKVLIQHGYYDLNTPFHLSEQNVANAGLSARIPISSYEGGHGIAPYYTGSYERVKQELNAFYDQSGPSMLAALNASAAGRTDHE